GAAPAARKGCGQVGACRPPAWGRPAPARLRRSGFLAPRSHRRAEIRSPSQLAARAKTSPRTPKIRDGGLGYGGVLEVINRKPLKATDRVVSMIYTTSAYYLYQSLPPCFHRCQAR